MKLRWLIPFLFSTLAFAQYPWSGILAPSRADPNWPYAGATVPTGAISNCATQPSAQTLTALNTAITADAGGSGYCIIDLTGWPAVNVTGDLVVSYHGKANIIIKGAGPQSTILSWTSSPPNSCNGLGITAVCIYTLTGAANFGRFNWPYTASITGGYSQGSTSLTLSGFGNLFVGDQIQIAQSDPATDNGNAWLAASPVPSLGEGGTGVNGDASQQGGSSSPRIGTTGYSQTQMVTVTACGTSTYGAACTSGSVTITPAIKWPNFTSGQNPTAWWSYSLPVQNVIIEGIQFNFSSIQSGIEVLCQECSNVAFLNDETVNATSSANAGGNHFLVIASNHVTIANSYMFGSSNASQNYGIDLGFGTSDSLVENNISQKIAAAYIMETAVGNVLGYNVAIDNYFGAGWQACDSFHHQAGDAYNLWEGNIGTCHVEDAIHGTAFADTFYRNYYSGIDPAAYARNGNTLASLGQVTAVEQNAYARYSNWVANVLSNTATFNPGSVKAQTTYQYVAASTTDCGPGGNSGQVWQLGLSDQDLNSFSPACLGTTFIVYSDLNVAGSIMRWGNWDAVTGAVRECASGSPSPCTGDETGSSASTYPGLSSPATSFPPSFSNSSEPIWWSGPWPGIGPDISSGGISGTAGHANLNPAANCYKNVMGGLYDGSSNLLTFNPSACYAGFTPQCAVPQQNGPNYSGTYTVPPTVLPVSVSWSESTAGCNMFMTLDGSTPTCSSTAYAAQNFNSTTTMRVIACQGGYTPSSVVGGTWTIVATGTPTNWSVIVGAP